MPTAVTRAPIPARPRRVVGGLFTLGAILIAGVAGGVMCAALLTLHEPPGRDFSPGRFRARLFGLRGISCVSRQHAGILMPLYGALAFWSISTIVTDRIFHDQQAVGYAMSSIIAMARAERLHASFQSIP